MTYERNRLLYFCKVAVPGSSMASLKAKNPEDGQGLMCVNVLKDSSRLPGFEYQPGASSAACGAAEQTSVSVQTKVMKHYRPWKC